jgi:hypothetical protein
MLLHGRCMLGIVPHAEQSAVHFRVKRLHAAVHHLRKAGQVRNVAHLMPKLPKLCRRPAGRDQLDAALRKPLSEAVEARLVRKRNERPFDGHEVGHSIFPLCVQLERRNCQATSPPIAATSP